jgi:hypothetical protein
MAKIVNDPYQDGGRTLGAFIEAAKSADKDSWKRTARSAFLAAGIPGLAPVINTAELPVFVRLAVQAALDDDRSKLLAAAQSAKTFVSANPPEIVAKLFAALPARAGDIVTHVAKYANPKARVKPFLNTPHDLSPFLAGSSVFGRPVTFAGNAVEISVRTIFEACAFVDGVFTNLAEQLAKANPAVINALREIGASDEVLRKAVAAFSERRVSSVDETLNQVILADNEGDVAVTPMMSVAMASFLSSLRPESADFFIPSQTYSVGGSNARNIAGFAMDMSGYQTALSSGIPYFQRTEADALVRGIHYPAALWNRLPQSLTAFLEVDMEGWRNKDRDRYLSIHLEKALQVLVAPLLSLRNVLESGVDLNEATLAKLQSPFAPAALKFVRGNAADDDLEKLTDEAMIRLTRNIKVSLPGEMYRILRSHVSAWLEELK